MKRIWGIETPDDRSDHGDWKWYDPTCWYATMALAQAECDRLNAEAKQWFDKHQAKRLAFHEEKTREFEALLQARLRSEICRPKFHEETFYYQYSVCDADLVEEDK